MESNKAELRNRLEWSTGPGLEGKGEMLIKEYKLSVTRWVSSENLMYNIVIVVDDILFYTWKLLRVDFKYSCHKKETVILWHDSSVSCSGDFAVYVF